MDYFERAEAFLRKNARPLDMARWNRLFRGGDGATVAAALKAYANDDGGFGHALEPDCWNPHSTPLQTWVATRIIRELEPGAGAGPIIDGILTYLTSGDEFDGELWHGLSTVASNDLYPRAPWWSRSESRETSCNPTASLIGFMLRYADEASAAYKLARRLLRGVYERFRSGFPLESMHEAACFAELYEYLSERPLAGGPDMREFRALIAEQINRTISRDTASWRSGYVCRPSLLIAGRGSEFYPENSELCDYEREFLLGTQQADGAWEPTWSWGEDYPEQWHISKNWWRSDLAIKNVAYIKSFD